MTARERRKIRIHSCNVYSAEAVWGRPYAENSLKMLAVNHGKAKLRPCPRRRML